MYKEDNKNRNMRIEKNFLEQKDFDNLYKTITNNWFGWFYVDHVADESDTANGYFAHMIYENHQRRSNEGWDIIQPIINKLKPKALIRIKANLYPASQQLVKHGYHVDQKFDCKSALYFVNTNNGYTRLKKEKKSVASVENSVLHFNSAEFHHSTNCTDKQRRITININYF